MKKIRKSWIIALSALLFVCVALFAVACDEGEANTPDGGTTVEDDGTTPEETTYYTVSLTYDETQGSVSLDPSSEDGKYASGTSVTLTVTPGADFEVDSVTVGESAAELSDGKYTFSVTADTAVSVHFKDKEVSVTAVCEEEQGSVSFDSVPEAGKVKKGTAVTATIEPKQGYEIVSVTVGDEDVTDRLEEINLLPDRPELNQRDHSPKRTLSLGELTEDTVLTVTFEEAKHSITLNVEGPGTYVLFDSTVSLEEQTALTSLTSVRAATKVHVVFQWEKAYVTPSLTVNDGDRTLKMSVVSGNTYFWVVGKDLTVDITFTVDRDKAPKNQITVDSGENGQCVVTPEGGFPYENGTFYGTGEATAKLTPDDGYLIESLKIACTENNQAETDVTADVENGSYTFPVTGAVTIKASFKKFEAAASVESAYSGTWLCSSKGESSTTTLQVVVSTSTKTITLKENGVSTASGTAYTATFGYTLYSENLEDNYVIYLLPELKNNVLRLTLNGADTYYIKSSTKSDSNAAIDAAHSIYDSTWYGGAASMPIKFEFGEVYIDGIMGIRLAKSETEEGLIYTVYANGGLYELIWTEEDDSLVLHPYGNSTKEDVPYTRETPPTPVPVSQYAGKYSNNEHTVDIDEEGAFSFDGTVYPLYYEAQMKEYYFKTAKLEYTVQFMISGNIKIFSTAANVDWTLNKIEEGTAQHTLTLVAENGTIACSPKNAEMKYYAGSTVTLTITPNQHYEVATITVNGEDKKFSADSGVVKLTIAIEKDTTVEVTFNELKEENLLSDLYIGVYTNGSITVTITATDVTVKWSGGSGNFTEKQITLTGTKTFTLNNTSTSRKFTIKINDDGSITLGDAGWAIGGGNYKLTKQATT